MEMGFGRRSNTNDIRLRRFEEVFNSSVHMSTVPPLGKGLTPILIYIASSHKHTIRIRMNRSRMGAGFLAELILLEHAADSSEADYGATNAAFHRGNLPLMEYHSIYIG
jgi:hypothetical protein